MAIYVYTDEPGEWQPGEDTVLYMPMNNDLLDHGYNNIAITHDEYFTIVDDEIGKKVGYVNGGTISYCTLPSTYSEYTLSLWSKSTYTGRHNDIYFDIGSTGYCFGHEIIPYRTKGGLVGAVTLEAYNISDIANGQRHNIIITVGNGASKAYVDGVLEGSVNSTQTTIQEMSLFGRKNINRGHIWNQSTLRMSELIFESKEWTAQEVSDYFNGTKSNYGIQ